jgi:hypothetical protein
MPDSIQLAVNPIPSGTLPTMTAAPGVSVATATGRMSLAFATQVVRITS